MASDDVLRRLAKNREAIVLDESLISDNRFALPEHVLWLAVIERAMMDYIGRTASIPKPDRGALRNFFFENTPEPHNLVYICNNLFDFPDAVEMIRKRIIELAKLWQEKPANQNARNYYRISCNAQKFKKG